MSNLRKVDNNKNSIICLMTLLLMKMTILNLQLGLISKLLLVKLWAETKNKEIMRLLSNTNKLKIFENKMRMMKNIYK